MLPPEEPRNEKEKEKEEDVHCFGTLFKLEITTPPHAHKLTKLVLCRLLDTAFYRPVCPPPALYSIVRVSTIR